MLGEGLIKLLTVKPYEDMVVSTLYQRIPSYSHRIDPRERINSPPVVSFGGLIENYRANV